MNVPNPVRGVGDDTLNGFTDEGTDAADVLQGDDGWDTAITSSLDWEDCEL